jgi:hypothetical protein
MSRPTYVFTPAEDDSVDDTYQCVEHPHLSIQVYHGRFIVNDHAGLPVNPQMGTFDTLEAAIAKVEAVIKEETQ